MLSDKLDLAFESHFVFNKDLVARKKMICKLDTVVLPFNSFSIYYKHSSTTDTVSSDIPTDI